MHRRNIGLLVAVIVICAFMCGCVFGADSHRKYMGFDKTKFTVVEEEDTHGGLLGDGTYYLILDCSSNPEAALSIVQDWKPMPLSENLNLIMYGGTRNGVTYGYDLAEEAHWPKIEHGYYRFLDDQSDDPSDDSGLLSRYSFNFEIAAYDTETHMFYFFRFDT